jgi:lipopolysaccharide transport system ATP-binding protein
MDSNDIIIDLKGICRSYKLYDNKSDRLREALNPLKKSYHRNFVALNNINLQVRKGEVLGIIGRNGSGKSTLLKIIAGILPPSSGELIVNGHIVPLIELGAGFNPDFTGLENIYFYNSIHGFGKEETDAMLDEILDFAEIGDFIRQPLKVYSSGMRARLAFAVSINIRPDVLILDEILSVGDELFRRKCFAKMEEFFHGGKTVLFVSHNANIVSELCTRCIWINNGQIVLDGKPRLVTTMYNRLLHKNPDEVEALLEEISELEEDGELKASMYTQEDDDEADNDRVSDKRGPENENAQVDRNLTAKNRAHFLPELRAKSIRKDYNAEVQLIDQRIISLQDEQVNVLISGDEYQFLFTTLFNEQLKNVCFRVYFSNQKGLLLGAMNTRKTHMELPATEPGERFSTSWKFRCNLLRGYYYIGISVFTSTNEGANSIALITDALVFKVIEADHIQQGGFVRMNIQPAIIRINADQDQFEANSEKWAD